MATKPRQRPVTQQRPISVTAVIDVVGVLASNAVHGHLYMYDTNKAGGSTGFGTEELRTRVRRGDQILWNVLALECEAYVAIDDIVVDRDVIEPERRVYPGTDVAYWVGTVKKDDVESLPYQLKFRVGTRDEPITATVASTLVG